MHTNNRMQNYWPESKTFIRRTWPKFTDVELNKINGSFDVFLEYLREYYGNFPLNEALARDKLKVFHDTLDEKPWQKTKAS